MSTLDAREDGASADTADGARGPNGDGPALRVDGLSKTFGSGSDAVTAVDDLTLTFERGSVVGLLGPNGAGKTTAIKSMLGLVRPDSGTVVVDGIDAHEHPTKAYDRVDAMLEGARNDYWRLTVRENLRYFGTLGGGSPARMRERHDALLDQLDLLEKADTPIRELSRGMKQKVSLASTLAGDVSVVFLDEPTLGLDVESSLALREELGRLAAERDVTVVISSHDMQVIEAVCDRVVILDDGRVVADDAVESLLGSVDERSHRFELAAADEDTVAVLEESFEVLDVDEVEDGIMVTVAAGRDEFYPLVRTLEDAGALVESVETREPSLEERFVEMVGDAS